jgi:hypothetical protein
VIAEQKRKAGNGEDRKFSLFTEFYDKTNASVIT